MTIAWIDSVITRHGFDIEHAGKTLRVLTHHRPDGDVEIHTQSQDRLTIGETVTSCDIAGTLVVRGEIPGFRNPLTGVSCRWIAEVRS